MISICFLILKREFKEWNKVGRALKTESSMRGMSLNVKTKVYIRMATLQINFSPIWAFLSKFWSTKIHHNLLF